MKTDRPDTGARSTSAAVAVALVPATIPGVTEIPVTDGPAGMVWWVGSVSR